MSNTILRVEDLSHRYTRDWAIRHISFEIDQHGVLGLLGSNGAGKSTTMNIMCGVLNQTEGKVWVNGIDMQQQPEKAKQFIGFLPQNAPLHLELTVDEYLTHCAYLRHMQPHAIPAALSRVKEQCGVSHYSKRLLKNLSGGYRQRVGIAQAIIHSPKLVVMDEPTNGLDPNQITGVRTLIREIAEERAVIFSSHILSEIQATCSQVKMIEAGRMVFEDTMDAFNNYIRPNSVLLVMGNPPAAAELMAVAGVDKAEFLSDNHVRLFFTGQPVNEALIRMSIANNWQLQEITLEKSSLDAVFAQLSNYRQPLNSSAL